VVRVEKACFARATSYGHQEKAGCSCCLQHSKMAAMQRLKAVTRVLGTRSGFFAKGQLPRCHVRLDNFRNLNTLQAQTGNLQVSVSATTFFVRNRRTRVTVFKHDTCICAAYISCVCVRMCMCDYTAHSVPTRIKIRTQKEKQKNTTKKKKKEKKSKKQKAKKKKKNSGHRLFQNTNSISCPSAFRV